MEDSSDDESPDKPHRRFAGVAPAAASPMPSSPRLMGLAREGATPTQRPGSARGSREAVPRSTPQRPASAGSSRLSSLAREPELSPSGSRSELRAARRCSPEVRLQGITDTPPAPWRATPPTPQGGSSTAPPELPAQAPPVAARPEGVKRRVEFPTSPESAASAPAVSAPLPAIPPRPTPDLTSPAVNAPSDTPANTPSGVVNGPALMRARAANSALDSMGRRCSTTRLPPIERAGAPGSASAGAPTAEPAVGDTSSAAAAPGPYSAALARKPALKNPSSLGPVSAAACNSGGAAAGMAPDTPKKRVTIVGAGALAEDENAEAQAAAEELIAAAEEVITIDATDRDIDPGHEADAIIKTMAENEEEERRYEGNSRAAKIRRRRRREKERRNEIVYDRGKRRPVCASCCALFCAISWLTGLAICTLTPRLYDGHTANEIDYWYPTRLCPRTSEPRYESFDGRLEAFSSTCQAVTPDPPTCGRSRACEVFGCTDTAIGSEQECSDCCGGALVRTYAPCVFPFRFADGNGNMRTNSRCAIYDRDCAVVDCVERQIGWCPTSIDPDTREPVGLSGECDTDCMQLDYVGSALPTCTPECPAQNPTPTAQTIVITENGWGGNSGIRLGADYKLVLFSHGTHILANVKLETASGVRLHQGNFSHHSCLDAALPSYGGRRLDNVDEVAEAEAAAKMAEAPPPSNRRGLLKRVRNWWDQFGHRDEYPNLRAKEGDGARWRGQQPVDVPNLVDVQCVALGETAGTEVYIQGSCEVVLGTRTLPHNLLRAELGRPFRLQAGDFPLRLTVLSMQASLRGGHAVNAAADVPGADPAVYFTLYTEELDVTYRMLMDFGIPLLYVLLSCGCCACLCLCATSEANKEDPEPTERLELTSLPDGGWQRTRTSVESA